MTKQRFTPAYPAELRERGVRLFRENRADYASGSSRSAQRIKRSGGPFECAGRRLQGDRAEAWLLSPDSLRVWCQQAERDAGQRGGLTSAEKDRIKELEREVRELRQANEILKKGETIFRH